MLQYNSGIYGNLGNHDRRGIIPRKLFIGGLSYDTTDNSLAAYFSQFGEVASATVLRDPVNSHSRGFGFVTFADDIGAGNVLAQSKNHIVDGRKVEAKLAFPKTQGGRQQQKPSSPRYDYGHYMGISQAGVAAMNIGRPLDTYSMQVPFPYEQRPMYPGQLGQDLYARPQFTDSDNLDIGLNPHFNLSSKNSYNNLSASVSSQSFQPEGRSPRSSVVESENFSQRDGQSLRRKTLSHIHVKADLQSAARKYSGLSGIGSVSSRLERLGLNNDDIPTEPGTICIDGIDFNTSQEELRKYCTTFGKVASARMDHNGNGIVVFEDKESAVKILRYQMISGNLFFDGKEITISRFENSSGGSEQDWNDTAFGGKPYNSDEQLFDRTKHSNKIPMLRAMSMTQSMLPKHEEESYGENKIRPSLRLMRDEKNRSLSVIAGINKSNSLLAQQVRVTNRRSSSFADRNLNNEDEVEEDVQ